MLKVFIDSDIILDLFAKREPHYEHAAQLFTLIARKKILGYSSPVIFVNIHYVLRKLTSHLVAIENLRKLKSLIKILPIDDRVIELALSSKFKDFEDSVQYHTAKLNEIKILITRNKKDYKNVDITILTAEEFLKILKTLE